jgi:hypothetical protein
LYRKAKRKRQTRDPGSAGQDLKDVINDLPNNGLIRQIRKDIWHRFRRLRNRFFHYDKPPTEKDTIDLVREVIGIEQDIFRLK